MHALLGGALVGLAWLALSELYGWRRERRQRVQYLRDQAIYLRDAGVPGVNAPRRITSPRDPVYLDPAHEQRRRERALREAMGEFR